MKNNHARQIFMSPLSFFGPAVDPHFFHSRIATAQRHSPLHLDVRYSLFMTLCSKCIERTCMGWELLSHNTECERSSLPQSAMGLKETSIFKNLHERHFLFRQTRALVLMYSPMVKKRANKMSSMREKLVLSNGSPLIKRFNIHVWKYSTLLPTAVTRNIIPFSVCHPATMGW